MKKKKNTQPTSELYVLVGSEMSRGNACSAYYLKGMDIFKNLNLEFSFLFFLKEKKVTFINSNILSI